MSSAYNTIGWSYRQTGINYWGVGSTDPIYEQPGWDYDQPLWTYEGVLIVFMQSLSMQARIQANVTRTLQLKSRIAAIPQIYLRGRIARREGWPIPDVTDPSFASFVPTQLTMRGRVRMPTFGAQAFQAKAKLFNGATVSMQIRGRVVRANGLSMQALIQGRKTVANHFIFYAQADQQTSFRGIFTVPGMVSAQSVSMQAKIAGIYSKRLTGHFLVPSTPGTVNGMQTLGFSATGKTTRPLMMRAFIVR